MSKNQVIKRAYLSEFKKCNPDKNGWTCQGKVFYPSTQLFKNNCNIETKSTEIFHNESNVYWRPISLKGIENNNGWISIDEFDKSQKICHIKLKFDGNELIAMFVSHKNCFIDFDNQQFDLSSVEYYIPVVNPESPVY